MPDLSCPSCGASLPFRSAVAVFAVCSYCSSTVVRDGEMLESIGKMAVLPDDISPIQIGSLISFRGKTFTVLGRYIMGWADGRWIEWFIDDGTQQGWLAHAQGFFSIAFERPVPETVTAMAWPEPDTEVSTDEGTYRVTDLKEASCLGSEGELPFRATPGLVVKYADMLGPHNQFASLEEVNGSRSFYSGVNLMFDELNCRDMRALTGWRAPETGQVRSADPQFLKAP